MPAPFNSCYCNCDDKIQAVTIKGIAKSDGTTQWEYGPGSWWRHHYGADAITGLVPDLDATLDKYAVGAAFGNSWQICGNRNAGTLAGNVTEAVTITKLDSLTGAVDESALMEGMFCTSVNENGFALAQGLTIQETCGLSGGGYVIAGRRVPFIEFEAYTLNGTVKEYTLHAHTQQLGNVYLRTRTSAEVITLAYNASASAVASAFAATADCTSCTATGGPWPHRKITVTATWASSAGDIEAIRVDGTSVGTTPGAGTSFYEWNGSAWVLLNDSCTTGTPTPPSFPGTFIGQGAAGSCTITGTVARGTEGAAATYDTATGLISNSVGRIFGFGAGDIATRLISSTQTLPNFTGLGVADAPIGTLIAGPDNRVVLQPASTASPKTRAIEAWLVGDPWTRTWIKWENGGKLYNLQVENGSVCGTMPNTEFFPPLRYRCGAVIGVASGTVTELDGLQFPISVSTTGQSNSASIWLEEGSSTSFATTDAQIFTATNLPMQYSNFMGYEVILREPPPIGDRLLLGTSPFIGFDADYAYGMSFRGAPTIYNFPVQIFPAGAITNGSDYRWNFYMEPHTILDAATEFRIRFIRTARDTAWLPWHATPSQIEDAVNDLFLVPSPFFDSICQVTPESVADSYPNNTNISLFELNCQMRFFPAANATGISIGLPSSRNFTQVAIELRNITYLNNNGISAWSPTDASIIWQRPWGTRLSDSQPVSYPQRAWIRGDLLYAYGTLVENEL